MEKIKQVVLPTLGISAFIIMACESDEAWFWVVKGLAALILLAIAFYLDKKEKESQPKYITRRERYESFKTRVH